MLLHEHQFGVRGLPQQEIREPPLARRPDHEVGRRPQQQLALDRRLVDLAGGELAARAARRERPGGARDLAPRAVRDRDVQHEPRGGDGRRRRLEPVQRRPGGARQALRRRAQDPAADAALDAAPLDLGRARDELAHERRHLARVAVPVLGREREDRQLRDAAAQAPVDDLAELARAGRVALEPPLGPERARAEASVAVHDDGDVPRRRPRRVARRPPPPPVRPRRERQQRPSAQGGRPGGGTHAVEELLFICSYTASRAF